FKPGQNNVCLQAFSCYQASTTLRGVAESQHQTGLLVVVTFFVWLFCWFSDRATVSFVRQLEQIIAASRRSESRAVEGHIDGNYCTISALPFDREKVHLLPATIKEGIVSRPI